MSTGNREFFELIDTPRFDLTGGMALHYWAANNEVKPIIQLANELGPSGKQLDLFITDHLGNSVLHYAAACSSHKVAAFLITIPFEGHFFNHNRITPAHIAAYRGDVKMLEILSKSKSLLCDSSFMRWTPLHYAVYYQHFEAVKFLLGKTPQFINELVIGFDSNLPVLQKDMFLYKSTFDIALMTKNSQIIQFLEENYAFTSLHAAISTHNLQAITYFLSGEQSQIRTIINKPAGFFNMTPLHIAASMGDFQVCHFLLQIFFSLPEYSQNESLPFLLDSEGFSPLDLAVASNSLNIVNLLIPKSSREMLSRAYFLSNEMGRQSIAQEIYKLKIDLSLPISDRKSLLDSLVKYSQIDKTENTTKNLTENKDDEEPIPNISTPYPPESLPSKNQKNDPPVGMAPQNQDQSQRLWLRHYYATQLVSMIEEKIEWFSFSKDRVASYCDEMVRKGWGHAASPLFVDFFSELVFVCKIVINRLRPNYDRPYSFSTSLHHLLIPLNNLIVEGFCNEITPRVGDLLSVFDSTSYSSEYSDQLMFSTLLDPLHWIQGLYQIYDTLRQFCDDTIDNIRIIDSITAVFKDQKEIAARVIDRVRGAFIAKLNFRFMNTRISIDLTPVFCASALIDDIYSQPSWLFDSSLYTSLMSFFGGKFSFPRTIPFRNRIVVNVVLLKNFIVIRTGEQNLSLPVILIQMRENPQDTTVFCSTPLGSFRLRFGINHQFVRNFLKMAEHAVISKSMFVSGDSQLSTKKTSLYKCVIAYQISGSRALSCRINNVKASSASDCFYICKKFVEETLSLQPLSFRIDTIQMGSVDEEIMII